MSYHMKWDIDTLENMIPFELDIYTSMFKEELEKTNNKGGDGGYREYQKQLNG